MSASAESRAEQSRIRSRAYYTEHKEKVLAASKERYKTWTDEYRAKFMERQRKYYATRTDAQRQKERTRKREYAKRTNRAQNRKAYNAEYIRRYYVANKARLAVQKKAYYEANKEKLFAKGKQWRENNPLKIKAAHDKRRALKKAATVNLRGIQNFVAEVRSKPFSRCYYCDCRVPIADIHFDHVIPLSKGGPHSVENLCVSCPACNLSKGAKTLAEWATDKATQRLLNL